MDSEASGPFEFAVTSAKPGNADSSGCSSFTLEPGESRICGLFHSTDPYLITVQAPVGLFGTWSVAGGCTLEEGTNESTLQASLLVSGPTAAACAVTFTPDDE
jgi:hypothetical protein